jgi:hypothetical protein
MRYVIPYECTFRSEHSASRWRAPASTVSKPPACVGQSAGCSSHRKRASGSMKRRISQTVYTKYASQFPKLNLFHVKDVHGHWNKIQVTHLADGALFDQIYLK